jgi:hypothetical protein
MSRASGKNRQVFRHETSAANYNSTVLVFLLGQAKTCGHGAATASFVTVQNSLGNKGVPQRIQGGNEEETQGLYPCDI